MFRVDIFSEGAKEITDRATHIFVYLQPTMLQKLHPLFEYFLEKKITIFSLDFEIPGRKASRTVLLEGGARPHFYEFGKAVHIYTKQSMRT